MKNLIFPILILLFTYGCSKPEPKCPDNLFEQFYKNGVLAKTQVSKFQFDTSEAIIVTGLAKNCSQTDSIHFGCVPHGANNNLNFTLRNLSFDRTTRFNDVFVMSCLKTSWKAIDTKIAPGAQLEVFSFNLKDLHKKSYETWHPGIPEDTTVSVQISLDPGIYEFTWLVGFGDVSEPLFFEIR